jgi:hypothetical protein
MEVALLLLLLLLVPKSRPQESNRLPTLCALDCAVNFMEEKV